MAAAALSRSRGVAGVRTTKGLFFIFSLLCLVCLASSLTDKDQLRNFQENFQKAQQGLASVKAQRASLSEVMSVYESFMDPLTAFLKETSKGLPGDFPPVEGFLQGVKDFMEKTKTYVDKKSEGFDVEIEKMGGKLGKIRKLIQFLEEQQAEL